MTVARASLDLMLACATWNASDREIARVSDCSRARIEWDEWLGLVRWHRLVPHSQRALAAAGAELPGGIASTLRAETVAIGAASLARAHQLVSLLRTMDQHGVAALPFKGPVLSLAAYGDIGVRDFVDLDIVVRAADVDRARAALLAAGYVSDTRMSPAQERMLQKSFGHFKYAAPAGGVSVELHWRFAASRYPWSLRAEDVFARAGSIVVGGAEIPVPDGTDQLLLQAMHGARHQWERLEWLVAFTRLLAKGDGSERLLIERARDNGSACALAVALRLARDLLRAPMTPLLASEGDAAAVAVLASAIVRTIESGAVSAKQPYAFNMRMMDGPRDRVRYIARSVFTPTPREWEMVRLPDALLFLYYPIRALRVLVTRARRLLSGVRR